MGISRKSRKVKVKKRQTGRKLRRRSQRSRLGKMSKMKGGAQVDQAVNQAIVDAARRGDVDNLDLQPVERQCQDITRSLTDLSVEVQRKAGENRAARERLELEAAEAQEQVGLLQQELQQLQDNARQAADDAAAQAARQVEEARQREADLQTQVDDLREELAAAQQAAAEAEAAQRQGEAEAEQRQQQNDADIADLQAQLATANRDLQAAQNDLAAAEARHRAAEDAAAAARQRADQLEIELNASRQEQQEAQAAQEAVEEGRVGLDLDPITEMIDNIIGQVGNINQACQEEMHVALQRLMGALQAANCIDRAIE